MSLNLPTLRQLAYLVAVVDHGHFGRAAKACFVTQSTLSAGIQELESQLEVTLVERGPRRVVVTPAGAEVARRAREILRAAEDLVSCARGAGRPLAGRFRLGIIPTIGPFLLPRCLPRLRRSYPELKLVLREDQSARVLARLQAGELDAAVLALPYPVERLEIEPLGDERFLLVCPRDHPLAAVPSIRPEQIPARELLLLEEGHCLRDHVLAACRQGPPEANQDLFATTLHTLVQMVDGGLGVTLIPKLAQASHILKATRLVAREIEGDGAVRTLALAYRRSSARAADARLLAEALRETVREMVG